MKLVLSWCLFLLLAAAAAERPALVPWPAGMDMGSGSLPLKDGDVVAAADKSLAPLAQVLVEDLHMIQGIKLAAQQEGTGKIILSLDSTIKEDEGYKLEITTSSAHVRGRNYRGTAWGVVTLLQCLKGVGASASLPVLKIQDQPVASYRGMLTDPARNHHDMTYLKALIQLSRLYKINYIQLHLNDKEGFRFASKAFPKFAEKDLARKAALTIEEWKELVRYADERGVTLVPEMEGPGHHAGALRMEWGRGNTLDTFNEKTYEGLKVLFKEVAEVFASSPYIHIGADEGSYGHLGKTPEEMAYKEKHGLKGNPALTHYIRRADEIIKGLGKKTICWEGFHGNGDDLPRDIIVMPFDSFVSPASYNKHGFPLINTAWRPLYVVGNRKWPAEYIYDEWNMWLWQHHMNLKVNIQLDKNSSKVLGAQMCAWEQNQVLDLSSLRERLHAMAERTWAPEAGLKYTDFAPRAAVTDRLLSAMIGEVNMDIEGLDGEVHNYYHKFAGQLKVALVAPPIGTIRYTIDNSEPGASSPAYTKPFELGAKDTRHERLFYNSRIAAFTNEGYTTHIKARIFDAAGQPVGGLVTKRSLWFTGGDLEATLDGAGPGQHGCPTFEGTLTVTLKARTEGTIRYTLDGSAVTKSSQEYKGPVKLTHDMTKLTGVGFSRATRRFAANAWQMQFKSLLFDKSGEPVNGLGYSAAFIYTGKEKPTPEAPVEPIKKEKKPKKEKDKKK